MNVESLLVRMDDNLASHASYLHAWVPGAEIRDFGDVLLTDSGLQHDTFNQVCRARFTKDTAAGRAAEILAAVRGTGRPFTWWVGPASDPDTLRPLLHAAGLSVTESEEAMWIDLSTLPSAVAGGGLDLVRISTPDQVRAFAEMMSAGWDPPATPVARFFELATAGILDADCPSAFVVGYADGVAVAAAEVHCTADVAGVYGVTTEPAYRRRGFGKAVTMAVLDIARRRGCRLAVLQASAEGAALYRRLGFQSIGRYTEHDLTA